MSRRVDILKFLVYKLIVMQKKLLFVLLFALLGFASFQIPVNKLAGSNVSFTFFDFLGPSAGAFLGGPLGVVAVFLVSLTNFILKGAVLEPGPIIRLFPTLFAVWYFSLSPTMNQKPRTNNLILAIPILAMLAFWAHPEGRQVWYYALFWTIPVIAFFKRKHLLLRSLGATFTAHAVGGAAWIWAFNLKATVWQSLIPVVITERLIFAAGIALTFIVLSNLIVYLTSKKLLPKGLNLETSYLYLIKK